MRSADEVLRHTHALFPSARAAIVGSFIDSLDEDAVDEQAEDLWSAEIARRVAHIDAGRVRLAP
jgi:putative addiction module component (TIGR02574 family)